MKSPRPEPLAPRAGGLDPQAVHVSLSYRLEAGEQHGADVGNPLFALLSAVVDHGSIRHAAMALGVSYRHAWGALKQWEQALGEPLVVWVQGQRARPTPFAERLLWAERRARARLQPHIEALRADLAHVVADAGDGCPPGLPVKASHDSAMTLLQQHAAHAAGLHVDLGFLGSADSLRALGAQRCLLAGLHVPVLTGPAPVFSAALAPLLKPEHHRLIGCATRTMGLMVRHEHAGTILSFADLARSRLRFINRPPGSGTRLAVDHLVRQHGFEPGALPGYTGATEETHAAVAACVASGLADVGAGIETAANQFGLHFVPLLKEDYFLVCLDARLAHPAVRRLCEVLAQPAWSRLLARLPGYGPAAAPGQVLGVAEALPWWRPERARGARAVGRVGGRSAAAGAGVPRQPL